jgi:hypothetical protein
MFLVPAVVALADRLPETEVCSYVWVPTGFLRK